MNAGFGPGFGGVFSEQLRVRKAAIGGPARVGWGVALLVGIVPVLLAITIALLCGLFAYGVARLISDVAGFFGGGPRSRPAGPDAELRRNVRVVER